MTADEQAYIKKQQAIKKENRERQWQKNKEAKAIKAAALFTKYQDNEHIKALLADHYGDDILVLSEFGKIEFSPDGKSDIVCGEKFTYDNYLDIQFQSSGKQRSWFEMCYHNIPGRFMGWPLGWLIHTERWTDRN